MVKEQSIVENGTLLCFKSDASESLTQFWSAHSLHSDWEVVVWDGAVSGGRGMQDSTR